jgi:AcrR family transcriptional regulator
MSADNKAKSIAAAALQILEHQGPEAVTMRRVAKAAGVTAMAIYHHFPSRRALLDAVTAQEFEKYAALLAAQPATGSIEKRFEIVLDRFLDFALSRPQVFDYVFSQRREGARRFPRDFVECKSPTFNALADLVREAIRTGYFRKGDVWEIALAIGAQAQGMITLYRGGRFELDGKEFRKLCKRTAKRQFDGLKKQNH